MMFYLLDLKNKKRKDLKLLYIQLQISYILQKEKRKETKVGPQRVIIINKSRKRIYKIKNHLYK